MNPAFPIQNYLIDPSAVNFDTVPLNLTFLQRRTLSVNFTVGVENMATSPLSTVDMATGQGEANFKVCVKLTDADIGDGKTDTLKLADIAADIFPASDAKQKLGVGSTNAITLSANATFQIAASYCAQVDFNNKH